MIASACLFALLAVAAATDFRRRKIYNWTTYPGIALALGLNAMAALLEQNSMLTPDRVQRTLGEVGLEDSLLGLLMCGALMLVCYVVFGVGGGDVKLMAMIGAFLGLERGLETLLWTFVLAACLGIIALAWKVGPGRLIARVLRQGLYMLRIGGWAEPTPEERAQLSFSWFLAPTALVAAALVEFELIR
ncbi:MAG TPA: A24 family peptidase [Pirellulales bacterium]|nr:A24 family peptidase [Pirellulales bacterium]